MDINKMKKGYHKMARELAEANEKVEQNEAVTARKVAEARSEMQLRIDELEKKLRESFDEHVQYGHEAIKKEKTLSHKLAALEKTNRELNDQVAMLKHDLEEARQIAETQQPRVDEALKIASDATELLAKVREHMSKKQREKENAILNRMAIAQVPGFGGDR